MISTAMKVTPTIITALAARNRPRRGTTARLVLIAPVEYSEVMIMIPRTPIASCAIASPAPLIEVGYHSARALGVSLAYWCADSALTSAPTPMPRTAAVIRVHLVEGTVRAFVHSERSAWAKLAARYPGGPSGRADFTGGGHAAARFTLKSVLS